MIKGRELSGQGGVEMVLQWLRHSALAVADIIDVRDYEGVGRSGHMVRTANMDPATASAAADVVVSVLRDLGASLRAHIQECGGEIGLRGDGRIQAEWGLLRTVCVVGGGACIARYPRVDQWVLIPWSGDARRMWEVSVACPRHRDEAEAGARGEA